MCCVPNEIQLIFFMESDNLFQSSTLMDTDDPSGIGIYCLFIVWVAKLDTSHILQGKKIKIYHWQWLSVSK